MLSAQRQQPYDVEIELEHKIYNPGQVIKGKIKMNLERKLHCQYMSVQLFGSARVFFTELQTSPGKLGQTKAFEQERILVNETKDLWASYSESGEKPTRQVSLKEITRFASPNAIRLPSSTKSPLSLEALPSELEKLDLHAGLAVGGHEFTFEFKLPIDGLYTSFDAKNSAGYVRYYIIVQAQSPSGHIALKRKLLFPVVCPRDLSLDSDLAKIAAEPINVQTTQRMEKGEVTAKLTLAKRGYVPGEPLDGHIHIVNKSMKSVKYCNLRIVQRTTCFSSRPEIHMRESFFETSGMGLPTHKVPANSDFSYPIKFNVPALLPNLKIQDCIEADYILRLDVGFKRANLKMTFLKLTTSIVIGTHPTSEAAKSIRNRMLPSAPPAYREQSMSTSGSMIDLPPSYASSVGGVSDVNGIESDGLINTGIYPLTYHYNFGYAGEEDINEKENKKVQ